MNFPNGADMRQQILDSIHKGLGVVSIARENIDLFLRFPISNPFKNQALFVAATFPDF